MQTPAHEDALSRDQAIQNEYQTDIKTSHLSHLQHAHGPRLRPLILVDKYYLHYRQVVDQVPVSDVDDMSSSSTTRSGASSYYTCLLQTNSETRLRESIFDIHDCEICEFADLNEQEENVTTKRSRESDTDNNSGKRPKVGKGHLGHGHDSDDGYLSAPETDLKQYQAGNVFIIPCDGGKLPSQSTSHRAENSSISSNISRYKSILNTDSTTDTTPSQSLIRRPSQNPYNYSTTNDQFDLHSLKRQMQTKPLSTTSTISPLT